MKAEKKQALNFQSFLESVPDAIVIVDKSGNIQSVNKQAQEMFGYRKNEIVGNKIELLIPSRFKEAHQGHRADFSHNPRTRKMGEGMQLFAQHKDGHEFPVEISLSKIDVEEFLVCASIRDASQQKKIEEELTKAKEKAENGIKAKQQFLSNMSHEIRTPMNAIFGFTKVLLKTDLTPKQKEYLTAIKVSSDTLIVLINDILDLAKVDAGKMIFEKVPFKLSLSISTMMHLFETKIQEKNLKLILKYDENIPEVLLGDPVRLHQIILNLISNAVKFTSEGKITVKVKKIQEGSEKVTLKFSIVDTGIGIEKNKLNKIFENFQQASTCTSRLYGGTGLGLAIVKQLVEKQGGTIQVKSKINEGSTFSFILTFEKTTLDINSHHEIIDLVDTNLTDIKVLVVEDVELNQLLMKTLLSDFGFECQIASNGQIAIEEVQKKDFDIILMDLQMPVMNGFQATTYIRETLKSKIPIIALTADITSEDVAQCKIVGMNDYIAKPVNEKELYSKMVDSIKKSSLLNEPKMEKDLELQTKKFSDMNYLNKITKSNPNLMIEMIEAYLKQTPPLLNIMEDSLKNKDSQSLKTAVHKLIPSFTIMGIHPEIETMAKQIQENAHTISVAEKTHNDVLHLIEICKNVCLEAEQELVNLKTINSGN